jgi:hypothetical protein
MKFKLTDLDKGWKRLMREVRVSGAHVLVGVTSAKGSEEHEGATKLSVASVGAVHEFGLGNAPERSFVRAAIDENESTIQRRTKQLAKAIILGRHTQKSALEVLGVWLKGVMVKRINAGIEPELKEATVKRKGSSKPLVDTGQLKGSIDFEVKGA